MLTDDRHLLKSAKRLARAGRIDELRAGADTGDIHAAKQLAIWLSRADRLDELRGRMAAGDQFARRAYSDWLVRHRRISEGIEVLRPSAESGVPGARPRLARLLAGLGHHRQAMDVLAQSPPHWRERWRVRGWLDSRGLIDRGSDRAGVRREYIDALRAELAAGDTDARAQLCWIVLLWWQSFEPRLEDAAALLPEIGPNDWLHESLVYESQGWWRNEFRAAAIDVLAPAEMASYHRTRAALLMMSDQRNAALTLLRTLSAAGDRDAQRDLTTILDAEQPRWQIRVSEHPNQIYLYGITFGPDSSTLAAWGVGASGSARAVVWEVASGAQRHVQDLSISGLRGLTFRHDGTLGELPGRRARHPVTAPNGTIRAVWVGGRLQLHSTVTDSVIHEIPVPAGVTMALSPDGTVLATSSGATGVHLWNTATGTRTRTITTPAQAMAFSPDGSLLATADFPDGALRFWSLTR
ncbi:WD40 repeat domain-containing protein [Nocardia sp. NPDC056100]|uniref:WD40 repeat domain-containing protein n=1 Tax=Nocardia sp. NPDC056100 TaxID=3345712 RepID=UPI0035DD1C21